MERKKISFLITILFCFFCSVGNVKATLTTPPEYYPVYGTEGDCVANNTCIRVCTYSADYSGVKSAAIYYYKSGDWQVVWESSGYTYSSIPNAVPSYVFSEDNGRDSVFINSDALSKLVKEWECPYGYWDELWPCAGARCGNAFCFDDDNDYCSSGTPWHDGFNKDHYQTFDYSYKQALLDDYSTFKELVDVRTSTLEAYIDSVDQAILDYENGNIEKIDLPTACSLRAGTPYFYTQDTTIRLEYANIKDNYTLYPEVVSEYFSVKNDDVLSIVEMMDNVLELEQELKNACLEGYEIKLNDGIISQAQYNNYLSIINENQSDTESYINDISNQFQQFDTDIEIHFNNATGCKGYLGSETVEILQKAFDIIKYLAIIILLVLSIIDFLKAIVSQDKDLLQKAIQVVVKRAIIAVIIFFLPILIEVFLDLLGFTGENYNCGIK